MKTRDILTNEDKYNLLTGRVPLMINRLLSYNFKENGIDLSREQWSLMAILWEKDGVSQQVLADLTYRDKPSTTRLIDNLEKQQYVIRRPHATDRRQNLIFLTEKGHYIQPKIMEVMGDTMQQVTEGLTEEQTNTIREAFETIYQNIKKII